MRYSGAGLRRAASPGPRRLIEEEAAGPAVPVQAAAYACARGHGFAVTLAAAAEPPGQWDCRCGVPSWLAGGAGPGAGSAGRPARDSRGWQYLLTRRTRPELEALLAERLAELHSGRLVTAAAG